MNKISTHTYTIKIFPKVERIAKDFCPGIGLYSTVNLTVTLNKYIMKRGAFHIKVSNSIIIKTHDLFDSDHYFQAGQVTAFTWGS